MKRFIIFLSPIFLLLIGLIFVQQLQAQELDEFEQAIIPQEEMLEAVVERIVVEEYREASESEEPQLYQKLELLVTSGSWQGQRIIVESGDLALVETPVYQVNDQVMVAYTQDFAGNDLFFITDYIRRSTLLLLFFIFVICAVAIAKWRGITSLIGMGISFFVIFFLILQQIYIGTDAALAALIGAMIIIPITFFLSHGLNKKTTVAIVGTFIALVITVLLANAFIQAARLTGFTSDEAGFLQVTQSGKISIQGLLLAGIIIGALGVLDDVTISQSAVVFQLKKTNRKLRFKQLYKNAMNVGQDHIASMVNTLILVYTGASLPLLLLFMDNPLPFSQVINNELIAEEIVRTLVGSIGLISAVPLTTLIAAWVADKATPNFSN